MDEVKEIRIEALRQAVKSFADFEQPRNAAGYSEVAWRHAPTTEAILARAKQFSDYLVGS